MIYVRLRTKIQKNSKVIEKLFLEMKNYLAFSLVYHHVRSRIFNPIYGICYEVSLYECINFYSDRKLQSTHLLPISSAKALQLQPKIPRFLHNPSTITTIFPTEHFDDDCLTTHT